MTDLKLKVERCDLCPLATKHNPTLEWRCHFGVEHCADGRVIGGLLELTPTPPDWCPIRGKVVTIEGPGS